MREEKRSTEIVWIIEVGPAADHDKISRRISAYKGRQGYGALVTSGASFFNGGTRVEVRRAYAARKRNA